MRGFIGHADGERSAVGIGIDGDAGDVHLAERANDAHRDFSAIGDQDLSEHEGPIVAGSTRSVTIVAPQPPASAGASPKDSTNGVRARTFRTTSRWTPIPRP